MDIPKVYEYLLPEDERGQAQKLRDRVVEHIANVKAAKATREAAAEAAAAAAEKAAPMEEEEEEVEEEDEANDCPFDVNPSEFRTSVADHSEAEEDPAAEEMKDVAPVAPPPPPPLDARALLPDFSAAATEDASIVTPATKKARRERRPAASKSAPPMIPLPPIPVDTPLKTASAPKAARFKMAGGGVSKTGLTQLFGPASSTTT